MKGLMVAVRTRMLSRVALAVVALTAGNAMAEEDSPLQRVRSAVAHEEEEANRAAKQRYEMVMELFLAEPISAKSNSRMMEKGEEITRRMATLGLGDGLVVECRSSSCWVRGNWPADSASRETAAKTFAQTWMATEPCEFHVPGMRELNPKNPNALEVFVLCGRETESPEASNE